MAKLQQAISQFNAAIDSITDPDFVIDTIMGSIAWEIFVSEYISLEISGPIPVRSSGGITKADLDSLSVSASRLSLYLGDRVTNALITAIKQLTGAIRRR